MGAPPLLDSCSLPVNLKPDLGHLRAAAELSLWDRESQPGGPDEWDRWRGTGPSDHLQMCEPGPTWCFPGRLLSAAAQCHRVSPWSLHWQTAEPSSGRWVHWGEKQIKRKTFKSFIDLITFHVPYKAMIRIIQHPTLITFNKYLKSWPSLYAGLRGTQHLEGLKGKVCVTSATLPLWPAQETWASMLIPSGDLRSPHSWILRNKCVFPARPLPPVNDGHLTPLDTLQSPSASLCNALDSRRSSSMLEESKVTRDESPATCPVTRRWSQEVRLRGFVSGFVCFYKEE